MTDLFQDHIDDPIIDENKDYLSELVGEGKKFSDPAALARGKYEADLFVERLKTEMSGLRNELNSRVKMEEFLDKLNSYQTPKSPDAGQQPPVGAKEDGSKLTPEDVLKLVDQREQKQKANENVSKVMNKLQESLGPNYATKLKQVTQSLGLSQDHINSLASTSPEALYKLLGLDEKRQDLFQSPPHSQVNTLGFKSTGGNKDWKYFDDIKKKDARKYWSTPVQNEMHALRGKGLLKTPNEES